MPVSGHTDTTEISTKNGCMRRYWKCLLLFRDRIWGSVHDVIFWQWKCQKSRQFCCWQCWDRFLLDFFVLGSRSIVMRLGVMSLTENWVLLISFLVKKHQLITIKSNHFLWLDYFYILDPENTLCKKSLGALFTISDAFWVYFHDLCLIMGYWKEGGLHALISPSLPLLHIYDFEFGPLFPWVHHKPLGSLQMFLCAHHFSQKVLQNGHEFKRPERKKMVWKPNDLPFSTYKPTLTKRGD